MTRDEFEDRSAEKRSTRRYRHLIEHVQDAVVEFDFVDGEPIVSDVNEAFVDIFGYGADEIRGEPLNDWVVPEWKRGQAAALDANTASGEVNYRQVTRETSTGLREFLYRGIPYEAPGADSGGFAVYTDLTEVSQNERQLAVLNRIVRHNLRNNANIIAGHTAQLLAELPNSDAATTDVAAIVERAARELEGLAEEAGHIQRVLRHRTDEVAGIDPGPLIRSVVDEHRECSPAAAIDLDLSGSASVFADDRLRYAVDSLVDNAIAHNPAPAPRVRLRVDRAIEDGNDNEPTDDIPANPADWVAIHVEDDGPRIPPNERDVIRDRSAITPTHHGSGLGLWLTELTVEMFGGELRFGVSELGGNDVSIRLRRCEDAR